MYALDGRTRDEEPFVNTAINWRRWKVLSRRNLGELRLVHTVWRCRIRHVGQIDVTALLLASNETFPSIAAFADDLLSILLVFAFAAECELVLGLSVWDLVDTEPFVRSTEKAREVTFDVLNIVELGSKGVVDLWCW